MAIRPRHQLETHTVHNQPAPRGDRDLWAEDVALRAAVSREGALKHSDVIARYGETLGRAEMREQGRLANRYLPELSGFDSSGRRIDEVTFHPSYHALMAAGISAGYSSIAWEADAGGHVGHAALVYLTSQVEPGVCCPMTMTYAAIPALRANPQIIDEWRPRLLSPRYDPSSRPVSEKSGATLGMAMTEKQAGSDLRATETSAVDDDGDYRLTGHKWFCSAPMSDAFLTLAQASGGLTCFLVPRWTPDDERNHIQITRLKDKLGNRSNASAEIEYHQAWARRLGEEGDGVRTILQMVHHTRLDTAIAPAGLMRAALEEAFWWCRNRSAFGRLLMDQPLMRSVLADLILDWHGALAMAIRVARSFDESAQSDSARAFARIAVALAKYWSNKRCPGFIYEAMECLGGSGYVEDSSLPLLYREAPLNSIWEGSGNVICLDILRAVQRNPAALEALLSELEPACEHSQMYRAAFKATMSQWPGEPEESEARWYVEMLALLLQASLLIKHEPPPIADAYVATRLGDSGGRTAGAVSKSIDMDKIIESFSGATQ